MKKAEVIPFKQRPRPAPVRRPKQKQVCKVEKYAFAEGIKLFQKMCLKYEYDIFTISKVNGRWRCDWGMYDTARRCWHWYVYDKTLLGKRSYSNRLRIAKKLARGFEWAARESTGIVGAKNGGLYGGVPPSAIQLLAKPPYPNQLLRDLLPCFPTEDVAPYFPYWWNGEGDAEIVDKECHGMPLMDEW